MGTPEQVHSLTLAELLPEIQTGVSVTTITDLWGMNKFLLRLFFFFFSLRFYFLFLWNHFFFNDDCYNVSQIGIAHCAVKQLVNRVFSVVPCREHTECASSLSFCWNTGDKEFSSSCRVWISFSFLHSKSTALLFAVIYFKQHCMEK